MSNRIALVCLVSVLTAPLAWAQQDRPALALSTPIAVSSPRETLVAQIEHAARLAADQRPNTPARGLDRATKGAIIGAAAGGAFGYLVGPCPKNWTCGRQQFEITAVCGGLGAALGAWIGAVAPPPQRPGHPSETHAVVAVSPIVGAHTKGAGGSISF